MTGRVDGGGAGVRRQLATLVAVAMSLVLLAFLIPLAIVLRSAAADRAIAAANDTAQTTAALIATDPETAHGVNGSPASGLTVTVFLPDGTVTGHPATRTTSIELASRGRAFTATSGTGVEALVPVQGSGGATVVRAYASHDLLRHNVRRTWAVLFALGVALLLLGLLLADRLGRRLVGAVTGLAATADRLASGDLDARAAPTGPRELRGVGAELNRLAGRISELLAAEREEVADLAHRLRTPVTALRLDADSIGDDDDRGRIAADVNQLTRVVDEVIRTARRPIREGAGARTDLAALVRSRVGFWTALADDDGRRIDATVPVGPVFVRCAEADLAAAFDALMQNVFAHTPEGVGMRVTIGDRTAHRTDGLRRRTGVLRGRHREGHLLGSVDRIGPGHRTAHSGGGGRSDARLAGKQRRRGRHADLHPVDRRATSPQAFDLRPANRFGALISG